MDLDCVLTFLMSAWMTFINIGMIDGFANRWMSVWLLAWPAAGIISFTFGPSIHRWLYEVVGLFPVNCVLATRAASALTKVRQIGKRRTGTNAEKIDRNDNVHKGVH